MITSYEIRKENNEEVLYLKLDFSDDFAKFNFKEKTQKLEEVVREFINKTKLDFKGTKVAIVIGGIVVGTLILKSPIFKIENEENLKLNNNIEVVENIKDLPILENSDYLNETIDEKEADNIVSSNINKEEKEEETINKNQTEQVENTKNVEIENNVEKEQTQIKEEQSDSSVIEDITKKEEQPSTKEENKTYVTVYRTNGTVINLELEEYVIGVVGAEMPASFSEQALMAQAIIARTYALKAKQTGKKLTDTVSTQSYIDIDQMKNKWGNSFNTYYNKIKNAVENTNGEYLSYNGNYIEALYHSTNNGKTESSLDVFGNYYPYLISVSSEYDKNASSYLRTISMPLDTISNKLGLSLNNDSVISILSYTDGGNIKEININGNNFSGKKVRELLGLRSADFDISISDNNANITTRGYGHGVGMSQYGANGMANAGYSYKDILSHYYPGTTLTK